MCRGVTCAEEHLLDLLRCRETGHEKIDAVGCVCDGCRVARSSLRRELSRLGSGSVPYGERGARGNVSSHRTADCAESDKCRPGTNWDAGHTDKICSAL